MQTGPLMLLPHDIPIGQPSEAPGPAHEQSSAQGGRPSSGSGATHDSPAIPDWQVQPAGQPPEVPSPVQEQSLAQRGVASAATHEEPMIPPWHS